MTQRERDEFLVRFAQATRGMAWPAVVSCAEELMRAASAHLRACEGDCSLRPPAGKPDDHWQRLARKAAHRAGLSLPTTLMQRGWSIGLETDPRGATLWLQAPNGDKLYPPARGIPARVFDRS